MFSQILNIVIAFAVFMLASCLNNISRFNKLNPIAKQIITGILLSLLSIISTHFFSIYAKGAIVSLDQILPLLAAFNFGFMAATIVGIVGIIDSFYFAYLNGLPQYMDVACAFTIAVVTVLSICIKHFLYKDKRVYASETVSLALCVAIVYSIFLVMFRVGVVGGVEDTVSEYTSLGIAQATSIVYFVLTTSFILNVLSTFVMYLSIFISSAIKNKVKFSSFFTPKLNKVKEGIYYYVQWIILTILILILFISISISSVVVWSSKEDSLKAFVKSEILALIDASIENNVIDQNIAMSTAQAWSDDNAIFCVLDSNKNPLWENDFIKNFAENAINESSEYSLYNIECNNTTFSSMWIEYQGYYFIYFLAEYVLFTEGYLAVIIFLIIQILIFIVLTFSLKAIISTFFVKKLENVNNSLIKITNGNLKEKVRFYNYYEFDELASYINNTVDSLKSFTEKEKVRQAEDIKLATTIQKSSLPNTFPAFPYNSEFDIYSYYNAAKNIGGDYFDYFFLTKTKLLFTIGDVSGKGIPAALFMMKAKTAYKIFSRKSSSPAQILYQINNYLTVDNDAWMFATCWLGVLDIWTGELKYAVAGHTSPVYIWQNDNKLKFLDVDTPNIALGSIQDAKYQEYSCVMKPFDKLILYTDGLTEGRNESNELYGEDRLLKVAEKNIYSDCITTCRNIYNDHKNFTGNAEQFDDICILILRYLKLEEDIFVDGVLESEISINADIQNLNKIQSFLLDNTKVTNAPESINKSLAVLTDELFSNLVNRAYDDSESIITLKLEINETKDKNFIKIQFIDHLKKFNPLDANAPGIFKGRNKRLNDNLGIIIVKDLADEISYEYVNNSNCLTIVKYY